MTNPPGISCRWDGHPDWCVDLWNRYVLFYKRAGVPIHLGTPDLLDAVEAEVWAEAQKARRERDKKEQLDFMKSMGLM